jgi:hypothetical protein
LRAAETVIIGREECSGSVVGIRGAVTRCTSEAFTHLAPAFLNITVSDESSYVLEFESIMQTDSSMNGDELFL